MLSAEIERLKAEILAEKNSHYRSLQLWGEKEDDMKAQIEQLKAELEQLRKLCQVWIDQSAKSGTLIAELADALDKIGQGNSSEAIDRILAKEKTVDRMRPGGDQVSDFVTCLRLAQEVFEQYKIDHPNWWKRRDGTPILNDVSVLMAAKFVSKLAEKDQLIAELALALEEEQRIAGFIRRARSSA